MQFQLWLCKNFSRYIVSAVGWQYESLYVRIHFASFRCTISHIFLHIVLLVPLKTARLKFHKINTTLSIYCLVRGPNRFSFLLFPPICSSVCCYAHTFEARRSTEQIKSGNAWRTHQIVMKTENGGREKKERERINVRIDNKTKLGYCISTQKWWKLPVCIFFSFSSASHIMCHIISSTYDPLKCIFPVFCSLAFCNFASTTFHRMHGMQQMHIQFVAFRLIHHFFAVCSLPNIFNSSKKICSFFHLFSAYFDPSLPYLLKMLHFSWIFYLQFWFFIHLFFLSSFFSVGKICGAWQNNGWRLTVDGEPREIQFWVANAKGSSYLSLAVHGQSLFR